MAFKVATKEKSRLRMALDGPSGSGKTYTGLELATAMAGPKGRVGVIDSERGSASKYADRFRFIVDDLESHHPERYIQGIKDAADAGVTVLLIDSLSHAWMGKEGALEQVDKAAARSSSGNSFAAWREVTPMHNKLVDAILMAPMHVIVTMRSKTEYVMEEQDRGGKKVMVPKKVGMAPIQRDGLEYEFDVVGDMDLKNRLVVSKTRCPNLSGAVIEKPGAELAEVLMEWLNGPSADEILTYVQTEADLCETVEHLAGLKKLLAAKGGAYFTDQVKDILRAAFERVKPIAEAEKSTVTNVLPENEDRDLPPLNVDQATGEILDPPPPDDEEMTPEKALAAIHKELSVCKSKRDFEKLKSLVQISGPVFQSPEIIQTINAAYLEMFPEVPTTQQPAAQGA